MTRNRATLRRLTWLAAALVGLTAVTGMFGYAAVQRAQRAAVDVRDDTVPAIVELAAARGALLHADAAAVESFSSDAVSLSGPGDLYRQQIAIANQNLSEAASHDLRDDNRRLNLANSLLTEYSSEIEQAVASFRSDAAGSLWVSDLWQASRTLRSDGGVLALLKVLGDDQLAKLDDQTGGAETVLTALLWLVPGLLLLVSLAYAQVWLWRRFRRAVNAGLVVATVLSAGVVLAAILVFDTGAKLGDTRDAAHRLSVTWQQRLGAADTAGVQALGKLLDDKCDAAAGGCGPTVQLVAVAADAGGPVRNVSDELTGGSADAQDAAVSATGHGLPFALLPWAAVLALLAVGAGLYLRFKEYWYRSG